MYNTFSKAVKNGLSRDGKLSRLEFVKGLLHTSGRILSVGLLCALLTVSCQLFQPILLRSLVVSISNKYDDGWKEALYLLSLCIVGALCNQMQIHLMMKVGQRFRATVMAIVFRQTLDLNIAAKGGVSDGQITNMISSDAQKFFDVMPTFNLLWIVPIQLVVSIYFLIKFLGYSSLAGIGVLAMVVPLNIYIANRNEDVIKRKIPHTDARSKLLSEVITGMRVIKYFNWEKRFGTKIIDERNLEFTHSKDLLDLYAFSVFTSIVLPLLAMIATFLVIGFSGQSLSSENAFAAIGYYNIMRTPLSSLGSAVISLIQALIAADRIREFICLPNTYHDDTQAPDSELVKKIGDAELTVCCRNASFSYDPEFIAAKDSRTAAVGQEKVEKVNLTPIKLSAAATAVVPTTGPPADVETVVNRLSLKLPVPAGTGNNDRHSAAANVDSITLDINHHSPKPPAVVQLKNINLELRPGDLAIVTGAVGSGKSTLINGLLREVTRVAGESYVRGRVVYVPQEAWIFNASVKDNIIFGHEWNESAYKEAVDGAMLWPDINRLEEGDETYIGEKGTNFSGGQKQRISIARAAYAVACGLADIVLLDDPLSALDASTGQAVFDNLFGPSGLFENTTRILVTHAVQYLKEADVILIIDEGEQVFCGDYRMLYSFAHAPTETATARQVTLKAFLEGNSPIATDKDDANTDDENRPGVTSLVLSPGWRSPEGPRRRQKRAPPSAAMVNEYAVYLTKKTVNASHNALNLMTLESYSTDVISLDVLWKYVERAGGKWYLAQLVVTITIERIFYAGTDWWMTVWTEAESGHPSYGYHPTFFYILVYIGISIVAAIFANRRTRLFAIGGAQASKELFSGCVESLMKAPMSFFEVCSLAFSPAPLLPREIFLNDYDIFSKSFIFSNSFGIRQLPLGGY
jgi:ATP-binding cassette subfamily C (CFTR/MRP) protein 1